MIVYYNYCKEIIKEIKVLYKTNQLQKIGDDCLDNLKYAYNILVLEYFKKELNNQKDKPEGNQKGVVIDVTDQ